MNNPAVDRTTAYNIRWQRVEFAKKCGDAHEYT